MGIRSLRVNLVRMRSQGFIPGRVSENLIGYAWNGLGLETRGGRAVREEGSWDYEGFS